MKHLYYVLDNKNVRNFFIDYYKLDCLTLDYNKIKESIEKNIIERILAKLFTNDYDFFKKIKNVNTDREIIRYISQEANRYYYDGVRKFEILDKLFQLCNSDDDKKNMVSNIICLYTYNFNTFKYFIEKYNVPLDKDLIYEFDINVDVINYFVDKANLNLEEFMLDTNCPSYIKTSILLCYPMEKEKLEMYYIELSKSIHSGMNSRYSRYLNKDYLELAKKIGFIIKPYYDECKNYINGYIEEEKKIKESKKKKNITPKYHTNYFKTGYDIARELIKLDVRDCD